MVKNAGLLLLLFVLWGSEAISAQTKLQNLLVESETTPIGIDVKPHFSWQMNSNKRGASQTAYRIVVSNPQKTITWDSGKVTSGEAVNIPYQGPGLKAETLYTWNLTVWDENNKPLTASSWFETGLMNSNPDLSAWMGATWIGGGGDTLVNFPDYFSIFKLNYTQTIHEGSDRAGFIIGANDPRLMDGNKNIFQLRNKKDESYIKLELDISAVGKSADGVSKFNVYRAGYTDTDKPDVPLASFDIPISLIDESNKRNPHKFQVSNRWGGLLISIDGNALVLPPKAGTPLPDPSRPVPVAVNPFGTNGAVNTFGMLSDMGFAVPPNQIASFSDVVVSNFRHPSNVLFKEDLTKPEYNGIYADDGPTVSVKNASYVVTGGERGAFVVRNSGRNSMPMLRTEFTTKQKRIERARLYVTARGIYEIYINGERVGKDHYNPGFTQYPKTFFYQTYDVTGHVHRGKNALGAMLGEGWWSGLLSFDAIVNHFGDRQSLLAKLVITYEDGSSTVVTTNDKTWKYYNDGPVVYSSLDLGEVYDARKEAKVKGWDTASFDDGTWQPAVKVPLDGTAYKDDQGRYDHSAMKLSGQMGNNAGVFRVVTAGSVKEVRPGVFVYDMGQNLTGVPKVSFRSGNAGRKVTLRVSEMLYPDLPESKRNVGMIMTENYRAALSQDVYTMKDGPQVFQPRFTSHGYQYLEITGIEKPLPLEDVQGVAISSVLKLTAGYETSNPKVNKLWSNLVWSNVDNFLSIPTDCPQRNERMGWGGDISVFAPTAVYVSNAQQFMRRHLIAMRDIQFPTGRFPDIAPVGGGGGGILWGSAGVVIPWESYLQYGDKQVLEEHYPSMVRYMDYLNGAVNKDTGMLNELGLGDWLGPQYAQLGVPFLATAYHIYDLRIMMKIAGILGKNEDAIRFARMHDERKTFFNSNFVNTDRKTMAFTSKSRGVPPEWKVADTQTSYAVGLALGAFNEENIPYMENNLVETVKRKNVDDSGVARPEYSLMTGFIGTSWISKALSDSGSVESAYRLLQNEQYPSWLYPVNLGATSIWERLNGYTVENGFSNNNSMNSFNHYSFGAVGRWMIAYSLGIRRDESSPGFKHFILQPEPDPSGQMTWARGHYDSVYGRINSSWKIDNELVTYSLTVPPNTTATLFIPASPERDAKGIDKAARFLRMEKGKAVYELRAGAYTLSTPWK